MNITESEIALLKRAVGGLNYNVAQDPTLNADGRYKTFVLPANLVALNALVNRLDPIDAPPPHPPAGTLVEIDPWVGSSNRRTTLSNGVVYTMRVPFISESFRASLAIVPAGSGSIGGFVSATRGDIPWDGSGGGAGGTFLQPVDSVVGDMWFTFRLGVDQPSTDVNVLVQY